MGTRGITAVIIGGERKVSQYGQWDHYPGGQGLNVLDILTQEAIVPTLRNKVPLLAEYTTEEWEARMKEILGRDLTGWINSEEGDKIKEQAPEMSRDTGSEILKLVALGTVTRVQVEPLPAEDDIWIEGMFTVDLDRNVFITIYDNKTVEFPLDSLPDEDVYLAAFGDDE